MTGAIQRLVSPPLSLIRDNQSGQDVRLDFQNGKFCEVNYRKGTAPKLNGNHTELFGNREISEIPYLLRLTHLLEQRGSGWFVQQDTKEKAGDLLEKLSIGRDLIKINSNKTSITRAATEAVTNSKNDLTRANEELSGFIDLLNKRTALTTEYTLKPLSSLLLQLKEIYNLVDGTKHEVEEKLNPILAFAGQIQSALATSTQDKSADLARLSKVENLISVFAANKAELNKKEKQLKFLEKINEQTNIDLASIKNEISDNLEKYSVAKPKLDLLVEIKNAFSSREIENISQSVLENQLLQLNEALPLIKDRLLVTINRLESAQTLSSKYQLLRSRETDALTKKGEISSLENFATDWQKHRDTITNIATVILPKLQEDKENADKLIKNAAIELASSEKKLQESLNNVAALKSVSDTILGAVGLIASSLPKDEGDCPVCTASYEPAELQKRMESKGQ